MVLSLYSRAHHVPSAPLSLSRLHSTGEPLSILLLSLSLSLFVASYERSPVWLLDLSRARSRHVGVTSLIRSNRPLLSLDLVNNLLSPPLITAAARERSNASAHASENEAAEVPAEPSQAGTTRFSRSRRIRADSRSIDGYQRLSAKYSIVSRGRPIHR